ncbi:MAG TPA: hypothetical protein VNE58_00650 [Casimicrobiaceae bacterium]|nr:hypothetical protein [Casimicrobiaceae bacterium]
MCWSLRAASALLATTVFVDAVLFSGAATASSDRVGIVEVTQTSLQIEANANVLCNRGVESALLHHNGTVAVERKGCGLDQSLPTFLTDVQRIEGSGLGQAPRMFAIKDDSTLVGWGDARCGLLGNEELARTFRTTPVEIRLRTVTHVANGSWFSMARTGDGGVYTWGLNYEGTLGLGQDHAVPESVACENEYYPVGHRYRVGAAVTKPTKVALDDIITIAADRVTAYALDRAGNVYEWGLIPIDPRPQPFGTFDTQPVPRKVAGLPSSIAIVTSLYMKFALATDGTVYGWGPNVAGNFGDGTTAPRLAPTRVPKLDGVVEIAASGDSPVVALLEDGTIRYWGGCCYFPDAPLPAWIRSVPTRPQAGDTSLYSDARGYHMGTLPPIHRVKGNGGSVLLYGVDGSLYQFPKSFSEPVFVLVSRNAKRSSPKRELTALEYHHAEFDHYFVTANADEIAKLDAGAFSGWRRTGLAFNAYAAGDSATGVCRMFSAFGEKSSHFYTANSAECRAATSHHGWTDEGIAFGMLLPDEAGNCPPYSAPLYRLYNNGRGGAPNHRFTTALSVRSAMLARGWVAEGSGQRGVVMCSPG